MIDGDASYFHESLIEQGKKGGEIASANLHSAIKKHIDTLLPGSDLPIMLHMFANLGGLSGLYVRNGAISSISQLFVSTRGFNSSHDMFNLIDAGTGKESADHKIRGKNFLAEIDPFTIGLLSCLAQLLRLPAGAAFN